MRFSLLRNLTMLALIIAASILYFWQLGRADIITDESSLASRAIGLVDFDFGIEQPTPWQWVDKIPWWMRLSFHDHPPLVFLLQHWSMRLFGENPTAIRIPSALAGVASVIFLYFIGKRLYSPPVGAISALLFAVTANHVWISRIGLQESISIAFILASVYTFLKALPMPTRPPVSFSYDRTKMIQVSGKDTAMTGNPKFLLLAGTLLGLAFLAKYLALILIPIFATILFQQRLRHSPSSVFIYDRKYKREKWIGMALAAILFLAIVSPVIIYNLQLYRNFGHFDFQFSMIFGQDTPHWQSRPGQEVLGSYSERLRTFIPRLIEANSPYFLILSSLGLMVILGQIFRSRQWRRKQEPVNSEQERTVLLTTHCSLITFFFWLATFLVFIGPAHRFLTLLTPWLALAAGYAVAAIGHSHILKNVRMLPLVFATFAAFVTFEIFYSYNSVIALEPVGRRPWAYSYLHRQAGTWGFNELEKYLAEELKGKMPETAITFEFPFAQDILQKSIQRGRSQGLETVPLGIVYNDNINLSAQLWVFLRRIAYQGWPVASAENFLRGGAKEFFQESGVKQIIFINAADGTLQDRTRLATPDGNIMELQLRAQGARPREIKHPRGEIAFRVYKFEMH